MHRSELRLNFCLVVKALIRYLLAPLRIEGSDLPDGDCFVLLDLFFLLTALFVCSFSISSIFSFSLSLSLGIGIGGRFFLFFILSVDEPALDD